MKKFIKELNRRNVIKAALSYIVFSWVLIQAASILYPSIGWGQDAISNTLIVLIIGFPVWLVFAFVFEWTPSGFKKTVDVQEEQSVAKETSKRLNGVIIAGLSLAVILLITDRIFKFTEPDKLDKSIAVLAFTDMSPEKNQEYFSDGISEEILNLLAKIPDLKVISRTSSFSYKGKEYDIKKIGEELQVAYVLEGSIRKSRNTFRITTQLINVADGAHLWSETYDREMADIFKIQDEIARKVTEQLKGIILGEEIKSKEVNTEAYNLYLQAKKLYRQDTAESRKNAVTLINQSIAIDSTYAPAWQYLSVITISNAIRYNPTLFEDKLTASIAAAEKAISLDANYASAYAILAYIQSFSWDFKSASINVEKALSIEPNNSYVINISALLLNYSAEMDKAIALYFKAISIDPLGYSYYFNLSLIYFNKKKYEQAEAALQTYLLHYPNASVAQSVYSQILIGKGEIQAALEKAEKETDPFWKLFAKSIAAYASDNIADADALLAQFVKDYGSDSWPNIAEVYAYRGEKDEAFKWLELAYENKDGSLFEYLNSPSFENLWGDPRWNKFINKLGLPEEHGFHLD